MSGFPMRGASGCSAPLYRSSASTLTQMPWQLQCRSLLEMSWSAVRAFANLRQRRSFKDFQRMAGWVNWALNVYPLLVLYSGLASWTSTKKCGAVLTPSRNSINNTISNELLWLDDHVERSGGVRIIKSPEWSRSEAHDTLRSPLRCLPSRYGILVTESLWGLYMLCLLWHAKRYIFFETLTVLSALSRLRIGFSKAYRLAILTDSLNTFGMFITLHALPAYNPILITATDSDLIASGIQLRVYHIPHHGESNKVADALSRLDVATAQQFQPILAVSIFSPPSRFTLGEARLWLVDPPSPNG